MVSFKQESEVYWGEWAASVKFPERLEIKIPIICIGGVNETIRDELTLRRVL